MAETVGWLSDKILIAELKIHHTARQLERRDVDEAHKRLCRERLRILKAQRDDLAAEISQLFHAIRRGTAVPRIYRQFKMYNDPRFHPKRQDGSP